MTADRQTLTAGRQILTSDTQHNMTNNSSSVRIYLFDDIIIAYTFNTFSLHCTAIEHKQLLKNWQQQRVFKNKHVFVLVYKHKYVLSVPIPVQYSCMYQHCVRLVLWICDRRIDLADQLNSSLLIRNRMVTRSKATDDH